MRVSWSVALLLPLLAPVLADNKCSSPDKDLVQTCCTQLNGTFIELVGNPPAQCDLSALEKSEADAKAGQTKVVTDWQACATQFGQANPGAVNSSAASAYCSFFDSKDEGNATPNATTANSTDAAASSAAATGGGSFAAPLAVPGAFAAAGFVAAAVAGAVTVL